MESREIRDLIESYYSVYDQDLNEMAMPPKDYDKVKKPQPKPSVKRGGPMGEQSVFNIIKGHLLDEGYANTERAALAIMANMSEEWKQSIVEGVRPGDVETPLDKAAFKKRRRSLAGREASADAKKRGHVDKFTGKPYGTEEAASRRKDIHKPEKAPEREARRKAEEDPD